MFLFFISALIAALVLAAVLAAILIARGRFYAMGNAISAQIQASGLSLQVGSWIVGWAPHGWFDGKRRGLPPTRLILLAPVSGDSRVVLQLLVLGRGLSFATMPPRGTSSWAWPGPGLRLV